LGLAVFDLLQKDGLGQGRMRAREAGQPSLGGGAEGAADLDRFRGKEKTKAQTEMFILDAAHADLPSLPFTPPMK